MKYLKMRPKKSHELRIQNVIKGGWNKLTNKTSTIINFRGKGKNKH